MELSLLYVGQAALLLVGTYVLWKVVNVLTRRDPFANIPGPPSGSWFTGRLIELFRRHGWDLMHDLNNNYGPVARVDNMYGRSALFVYDPVAMHNIVVKEQHIFEESDIFVIVNRLELGKGLLGTLGEQHRKQRKLLNPVFSINHMRYMIPIFYEVAERLGSSIAAQVSDGPRTVDLLGWSTRCALELIGQGGLGHSFDDLKADTENSFAEDMKNLNIILGPLFLLVDMCPFLFSMGTPRFRRWIVDCIPNWRVRKATQIIDNLQALACGLVEGKRKALEQGEEAVVRQIGSGKDIMSRLLQANMEASDADRLEDEEVIAQIATFIVAAMDTTSGSLARILHIFAEHPDAQERARQEILEALKENDGEPLSYDQLSELPYLEAVCRETLRIFPPLTSIIKTARQDTVLPLGNPIRGKDGTLIHEIAIPKNTDVVVGLLASNRAPALWGPDSDEWKPERWLKPLPEAIVNARIPGVYSNLMTFLGGGRACIGFKFAQLEMKIVLVTLLQMFKFSISTDIAEPIHWNLAGLQYPSVGPTSAKAELPLKVERL